MDKKKTKAPPKAATTEDLGNISKRLESARLILEKRFDLTPAEKRKILKSRSKALAQEPIKEEAAEDYFEVVEFSLADERYAVEGEYVREVIPLKELNGLPCTPPFILGIINVRGQILTVVDIKKFFDLPKKGITDLNKVIIVKMGELELGILADAIIGNLNISLSELQPALPTLTGIREDYLKGVAKGNLVVLDMKKLLTDKRIIVHEEVET